MAIHAKSDGHSRQWFPNCALPLDRISIVAQAMDEAGNTRNSAENSTLNVASPYVFTTEAGFTVQTLGFGNRLRESQDAILEPVSGRVIASNFANDRAIVIFSDRTQDDLRDAANTRM